VRRSLHFCWPRAETRLYQEQKNLVEHGLARAKVTIHGRRPRTVYSITPKGRKALTRWLEEPSAPPRYESEALLRLFFADHGTKEALLATLAELEAQADRLRAQTLAPAPEYLGQGAPFPERIHILGLVGKFALDQTTLVTEWARWARAEVEGWPDVAGAPPNPEAVEAFRAALEGRPQ
jgi:DNA-binding PadR family transcriptional regulator